MAGNPTPLIAIKGRLHSHRDHYYGLFLLVVNEEMNTVESGSIVVSVYSELFQTELSHSWRSFETKINELKYRNQYAPLVTQDLQDRLKSLIGREDFYEELMKGIRANATKQLAKVFQVIFNRSIRDPDLEIEVALEWLKQEDLEAPSPITETVENPQPESMVTQSGVSLPVSLVLAPVGGKPVTDLKRGDQIMVRIIPLGDRANYFIDLMQLRGEKGVLPCPMSIEMIQPTPNGLVIRGKLDENLFGELTETEKVLVQMAQTEAQKDNLKEKDKKPTQLKTKELPKVEKPNRSLMIIASISLLLLGVLIYLIASL